MDNKWNKWLIIGGLVGSIAAVLLGGLNSVAWLILPRAIPLGFGGAMLLILLYLGMAVFWFGILNYTKLGLWVKIVWSLVLGIVGIVALVIFFIAALASAASLL